MNLPFLFNLTPFNQPGIYTIECFQTGACYVGETENLLERVGKHISTLNDYTHDCKKLQKDWILYGAENFNFYIIVMGPEWKERSIRKVEEQKYINQLLNHRDTQKLYNTGPANSKIRWQIEIDGKLYPSIIAASKELYITPTTLRRRLDSFKFPTYQKKLPLPFHKPSGPIETRRQVRVSVKGQTYDSIAKASRSLRMSPTTLRSRLDNPSFLDYQTLEIIGREKKTIQIDGKAYSTILEVIDAGLASNRLQVYRRVYSKAKKWGSWCYIKH